MQMSGLVSFPPHHRNHFRADFAEACGRIGAVRSWPKFSLIASSSSTGKLNAAAVDPPVIAQMPAGPRLVSNTVPASPSPASMKTWSLTDQHLFVLSVIACMTGGAVMTLFLAAIPTLLAFKRAAESLEKLLEVTREELPGTMAAVRLSGMEISDLTMELSELGQEISSGVKSSARAVRAAQDGLRRVSSIASMAFLQKQAALPTESVKLATAPPAKGLREKLLQVRTIFSGFVTLNYCLGWIKRLWIMRRARLPASD